MSQKRVLQKMNDYQEGKKAADGSAVISKYPCIEVEASEV